MNFLHFLPPHQLYQIKSFELFAEVAPAKVLLVMGEQILGFSLSGDLHPKAFKSSTISFYPHKAELDTLIPGCHRSIYLTQNHGVL